MITFPTATFIWFDEYITNKILLSGFSMKLRLEDFLLNLQSILEVRLPSRACLTVRMWYSWGTNRIGTESGLRLPKFLAKNWHYFHYLWTMGRHSSFANGIVYNTAEPIFYLKRAILHLKIFRDISWNFKLQTELGKCAKLR